MGAFATDSEAGVKKQETSEDVKKASPEETQAEAKTETPDNAKEADVKKEEGLEEAEALKSMVSWLEKGGDKADAPKEALSKVADLLKALSGEEIRKDEGGKVAEEGKSDKPAEPEPVVKMMADGSIQIAPHLQKGKTFTTGRTDAIKDAISGLAGILGEVDADGLGDLVEKLQGMKTPGPSVAQGVKPVETKKAAKEEEKSPEGENKIEKALQPFMEKIEDVSKRLEVIEKARTPSKSVEGDGDTDGQQEDVEKSMWTGVL